MKKQILSLSIFFIGSVLSFDANARYIGDLNGDTRVDLADMACLAKALKTGSTDLSLDINDSGKVDENDLHALANIIISRKMTEDSGLNVGIGGWDDNGEDYGGTVRSSASPTRAADGTRFYLREPKKESNNRYSMELGISEGDQSPAGILFNIRMPQEMKFDESKIVELDPTLSSTHKLYGTPKFVEEIGGDEPSLRFIILSPDLEALPASTVKLGRIHYDVENCQGETYFKNTQTVSVSTGDCTDIPEHHGGYNGNFKPASSAVEAIGANDTPCDIYTIDGRLLKTSAPAYEIQNLKPGLYLISKKGVITKLLK